MSIARPHRLPHCGGNQPQKWRRRTGFAAAAMASCLPLLLLTGCGGGGSHATSAAASTTRASSVTFSFHWPSASTLTGSGTATRALPESAASVRVTVTDAAGFVQTATVNRPDSTNQTVVVSFTGLAPGSAAVVFTAFNSDGGIIDTTPAQTVTLVPAVQNSVVLSYRDTPFTGVAITPAANATVTKGQTLSLTAGGYSGGNLVKTSPSGTWNSSDTEAATVSSSGLVTAINYGSAVITFTDTSGFSATVTVTIPQPGFARVSLTANGSTSLLRPQTVQLSASGLDTDGSVLQANPPGTWTSSDSAIATVDANGLVTSVGNGTAMITFTDSQYGKSASITVTSRIPLASVAIAADEPVVVQGQTLTFTANGFDAEGNLVQTTVPGTWTSDDPKTATVDPNTGVVTGVFPGTTTIRFTDSTFGKTAAISLRVRGGDSTVIIQ